MATVHVEPATTAKLGQPYLIDPGAKNWHIIIIADEDEIDQIAEAIDTMAQIIEAMAQAKPAEGAIQIRVLKGP